MKKHIELPQVDEVELRPFLGVRPGIYIFALLAILVLGIVFLVCFLPGVRKGGRYVTFSSPLAETGVYLDDVYLGGTPYQYFVPSGEHRLAFKKAGVEVGTDALSVDHPVFLTYLFHRTMEYGLSVDGLSDGDKETINRFGLEEIVRESAILDFDSVRRYAPVFVHWATDAIALDLDEETISDSLALAFGFVTSSEMLEDAQDAVQMLEESGKDVSTPLLEKTVDAATLLFGQGKSEQVGVEASDLQVEGSRTTLSFEGFEQDGFAYGPASFVMGDVALSIYPDTNEAGVAVDTAPFAIASTPVTDYQWAQFVEENPGWGKDNIESLRSEGLVDEYYLSGIVPSKVFATGKPVHNVSHAAATAFCEWVSEKSGKRVFLPSESQWSLAAASAADKPYLQTFSVAGDTAEDAPSGMLGGVWEFTDTPYVPLARLTDYGAVMDLVEKFGLDTDVVVKGGSYLNDPSSVTIQTVGAVGTEACADQIGFRIAWEL
jgi:hypothetical protein